MPAYQLEKPWPQKIVTRQGVLAAPHPSPATGYGWDATRGSKVNYCPSAWCKGYLCGRAGQSLFAACPSLGPQALVRAFRLGFSAGNSDTSA